MILEQKLNQSLKLSQTMKMSLNILEMSMLNLNNFIKNEFSNKFGVEVNYSKQEDTMMMIDQNFLSQMRKKIFFKF